MVSGKDSPRRRKDDVRFSAEDCGSLWRMDKQEHGARLERAMSEGDKTRGDVADVVGVSVRTVTNWTSGKTLPTGRERASLRKLFPGYDAPGDQVERAVRESRLTEWRQDSLIGEYKRHLHEQRGEVAG